MSTRSATATGSCLTTIVVLTILFAIAPRAYGAEKTYDIDVEGGGDVIYQHPDPAHSGQFIPFKMQAWHRLLAFHTYLREQLGVAEGADLQSANVGCVSKLCESLEPIPVPAEEGALPPYKPAVSVTYRVYQADWDSGRLKGIFEGAEKSIADADSLKGSDFNVKDPIKSPDGSTCIPPYQPPCYDRPVCTLYGGCSRSSTSCVKCVK